MNANGARFCRRLGSEPAADRKLDAFLHGGTRRAILHGQGESP